MTLQKRKLAESITSLTASELARKIRNGELSAQEAVEAHIQRIEEVNRQLNAVVITLFDQARTEAAEADEALKTGKPVGPLHGVPITIKEQFDVAGTEKTAGVPTQKGKKAEKDGPLVARLRQAGAIILGKTNVMMTLLGWESDNPVYGKTNNPWKLSRTPGGSSGGETAIIAARGSPLGLAWDLGGSIRVPSHFCGVHGLKPTSGRFTNADLPRELFSSGQENIVGQSGPIARSVADLKLMMKVLADPPIGNTPDVTPPVPWADPDAIPIKGLKVGMYTDNGVFPVSPAIRRAVEESASALKNKGAVVKSFVPPDVNEAFLLQITILFSGGSEFLPRALDGSPPNQLLKSQFRVFSIPVPLRGVIAWLMERRGQKRLASVLRAIKKYSSEDYWRLIEKRNAYRERFLKAMDKEELDAIICPPYATVAPLHGATEHMPAAASYAMLYNVLGMPAGVVSVTIVKEGEETDGKHENSNDRSDLTALEVEKDSVGLPVGVQVTAHHWREDVVLKVMEVLEEHFKAKPTYPLNQELLQN